MDIINAESALIGSILLTPGLYEKVSTILSADDFEQKETKFLFNICTILRDIEQDINTVNVITYIEGRYKDKEKIERTKKTLSELTSSIPAGGKVDEWIESVLESSKKRQVEAIAKDVIENASKNADLSASDLAHKINDKINRVFAGEGAKTTQHISKALADVYERLENLSGPDRAKYIGISTGYPDLDKMISGLNKSDLIIIAGRPAMGKTALGLNIAANVAIRGGRKVAVFSLEMTAAQLTQRIVASEAHISSSSIRNGSLTPAEWHSLSEASCALSKIPLYINDDSETTVAKIKNTIKELGDVELVVIDYLSLMKNDSRSESRTQEVSEITRKLKLMAKDLNVPVIVLCQLNRAVEARNNADHMPQLADLRESGSIEQDADAVIMIYRKDYYKNADYTPTIIDGVEVQVAELLVRKNRHGPVGDVRVAYIPEWTKFDNIKKAEATLFDGE